VVVTAAIEIKMLKRRPPTIMSAFAKENVDRPNKDLEEELL
jgi:hypothetical protein